jgi:hypothetical protein
MVEVDIIGGCEFDCSIFLLDGGEGKLLTNNKPIDIETKVVPMEETGFGGLESPRLDSTSGVVKGADTPKHRIKNKCKQKATLATQAEHSSGLPIRGSSSYHPHQRPLSSTVEKCNHLAWLYFTLQQNSSRSGLPMDADLNGTAMDTGTDAGSGGPGTSSFGSLRQPHRSLQGRGQQIGQKRAGQASASDVGLHIKDNLPAELKISPITAIPHKSKLFCSILDLLFRLPLKQGGILPLVNATTIKNAPKGAIDQLGHSLT